MRQADKAPSLDMGGVCVNRIGTLQLSIIARVQGLRRQAVAQSARQTQPKGPHELGDLPPAVDCLPPPGTCDPPGMEAMIDPPQVLSEEPTAVTPHGGICGGESQQWLSYPTKPHAGICAGGREQSLSLPRPRREMVWPRQAYTHNIWYGGARRPSFVIARSEATWRSRVAPQPLFAPPEGRRQDAKRGRKGLKSSRR